MGRLEDSDAASRAVQKAGHPRISLDYIKARVAETHYRRAKHAKHKTVCEILFDNGFSLSGESAPADPANFNAKLGRQYAFEDAIRKAWPLFGFMLCEDIAREKDGYGGHMRDLYTADCFADA